MSRVLFHRALTPPVGDPVVTLYPRQFEGRVTVPNICAFAKSDEELFYFNDRSIYRSISRSALLLSACSAGLEVELKRFTPKNPFSVGIYYAGEWGSIDYANVMKMSVASDDQFASSYKRYIPPKQPLRYSVALVPAQLGIYLETMGPINTYIHSTLGCLQAVDQAELDLDTGAVSAALVCAAMSLDDVLLCTRTRQTLHP
jgi:hypothetical protein